MILFETFTSVFMQRALLAGAILAPLLAGLGIYVSLRKMAFFGDGIAHASLAGIAAALLAGWAPLPVALVWSVVVALAVWRLERKTRLPSDVVIGILFTSSLALGVVLMSLTRGYQPDLVSYMFGSILGIRPSDIAIIAGIAAVIALWTLANWRPLAYLSLSEDAAAASGVPVSRLVACFYVALALAVVLGVKVIGIVLVSALLILPPAAARLLAGSFRDYVLISLGFAELAVLVGLIVSYAYDLPSGAVIVLASAVLFFLAAIVGRRR